SQDISGVVVFSHRRYSPRKTVGAPMLQPSQGAVVQTAQKRSLDTTLQALSLEQVEGFLNLYEENVFHTPIFIPRTSELQEAISQYYETLNIPPPFTV